MEQFKGTSGPWYYGGESSKAIFKESDIGYRLAIVEETFSGSGWTVKANNEWEYNARLISAAPDLLELVTDSKELLSYISTILPNGILKDTLNSWNKLADTAINKALGK